MLILWKIFNKIKDRILFFYKTIYYIKNYFIKRTEKNLVSINFSNTNSNEYFPIYKELKKRNIGVVLLFGKGFKKENRYCKYDFCSIFFLKKLSVKVVISDGGRNFENKYETIAIFHGFASINSGFQPSFIKNYKHIFMRLKYHEIQFKENNKLKDLISNKKLYRIGSPKIDGVIKPINNQKKIKYKSFFYAPTYHVEISSIFYFLNTIVKYTKNNNIKLFIKLHPAMYLKNSFSYSGDINFEKKIHKLALNYDIELIKDNIYFTKLKRMFNDFDLIITDTSAMAYEFCLVSGKPAVFVGEKLKIPLDDLREKNYSKYIKYPEVFYRYEKLGPTINKPEKFHDKMDWFAKNFDKYNESIKKFRNDFTYNLGNASEIAVDSIIKIMEKESKDED